MSKLFDTCFEILIGHEGGLVDDPKDPGGKTNWGISSRSYPHVDVAKLTKDGAKELYLRDYWRPIRGDELPPGLALLVFDAAVNNGAGTAVKWLQRAAEVPVDGMLGPMTLAAASVYGVDMRFHLQRVVAMTKMPGWPHDGRGWAIRLATLPFQAAELDS